MVPLARHPDRAVPTSLEAARHYLHAVLGSVDGAAPEVVDREFRLAAEWADRWGGLLFAALFRRTTRSGCRARVGSRRPRSCSSGCGTSRRRRDGRPSRRRRNGATDPQGQWGRARLLRPRPVLQRPVRLLRLQHLHRRPSSVVPPRRPGRHGRRTPTAALAEVRFARATWPHEDRPVSTVFFGGGTPTLLPPEDLTRILAGIDEAFGLAPGAEVTTEANPDSVSADDLVRLREGGVDRISFGMQSAVVPSSRCSTAPTTPSGCRGWSSGRGSRGSSRSAWTSSTARPASRWRTGRPRSTPPWPARPTTCRRTPSSWSRAPPWPGGCDAARWRRSTTTTWPTSTSSPTSGSPPRASGGTRCPTGRATTPRAAATTSVTGAGTTGGAWGRERTRTATACGGGTSSTPRSTRGAGRAAPPRRRGARSSTAAERHTEALLLGIRLAEGLDPACCRRTSGAGCPASPRATWSRLDGGRIRLTVTGRLLADAVVRELLD